MTAADATDASDAANPGGPSAFPFVSQLPLGNDGLIRGNSPAAAGVTGGSRSASSTIAPAKAVESSEYDQYSFVLPSAPMSALVEDAASSHASTQAGSAIAPGTLIGPLASPTIRSFATRSSLDGGSFLRSQVHPSPTTLTSSRPSLDSATLAGGSLSAGSSSVFRGVLGTHRRSSSSMVAMSSLTQNAYQSTNYPLNSFDSGGPSSGPLSPSGTLFAARHASMDSGSQDNTQSYAAGPGPGPRSRSSQDLLTHSRTQFPAPSGPRKSVDSNVFPTVPTASQPTSFPSQQQMLILQQFKQAGNPQAPIDLLTTSDVPTSVLRLDDYSTERQISLQHQIQQQQLYMNHLNQNLLQQRQNSMILQQPPGPGGKKFDKDAKKANLYKTELCRSWEETGHCRYGAKCQFAHSEAELRAVDRHPKYKTSLCKTFWELGSCPYGMRCCFIHTTRPDDTPASSIPANAALFNPQLRRTSSPVTPLPSQSLPHFGSIKRGGQGNTFLPASPLSPSSPSVARTPNFVAQEPHLSAAGSPQSMHWRQQQSYFAPVDSPDYQRGPTSGPLYSSAPLSTPTTPSSEFSGSSGLYSVSGFSLPSPRRVSLDSSAFTAAQSHQVQAFSGATGSLHPLVEEEVENAFHPGKLASVSSVMAAAAAAVAPAAHRRNGRWASVSGSVIDWDKPRDSLVSPGLLASSTPAGDFRSNQVSLDLTSKNMPDLAGLRLEDSPTGAVSSLPVSAVSNVWYSSPMRDT